MNAFSHVDPERALAAADAVRPGDSRPLCGVPIAVKDLLGATEGMPTTNGSAAFGDWVAEHDTAHIRRLREAGAIVVGKTTTPGAGPAAGDRVAALRHHQKPARPARCLRAARPAAALRRWRRGWCRWRRARDLGGSIRIPASCCGVVGLKPSRGRVSIGPDFGDVAGGVAVDGPIARTTRDAAIALDAMAGYEPGDHIWLDPPAVAYAESIGRPTGPVPIRLATTAPLGVPVDDEPRAAAEHAAAVLRDLGHPVEPAAPDWDDDGFPAAWSTFATGAVQHILRVVERLHGRPLDPAQLEPATRAWLVDGPQMTLVDYLEAKERLIAFSRRLLRTWPPGAVLVTPTLTRLPAEAGGMRSQAGVTDDGQRFSALVRIWNVTGQPAISLPLSRYGRGRAGRGAAGGAAGPRRPGAGAGAPARAGGRLAPVSGDPLVPAAAVEVLAAAGHLEVDVDLELGVAAGDRRPGLGDAVEAGSRQHETGSPLDPCRQRIAVALTVVE